MNFAAFNFLSVKPAGWTLAICALIFVVTDEAKMPAADAVNSAAGDILSASSSAVIGVSEKSAGLARGRQAGSPTFYNHKNKNGRPVVLAPNAAMAVSAAYHPELRRA